jgi:hypothetical protein
MKFFLGKRSLNTIKNIERVGNFFFFFFLKKKPYLVMCKTMLNINPKVTCKPNVITPVVTSLALKFFGKPFYLELI